MAKLSIIEAFRRSRCNKTSFIDELYAACDADEALIASCLAGEAGLTFEEIPRDMQVIAPSGADFAKLRRIRSAILLAPDNTIRHYTSPTLGDIAVMKRDAKNSRFIARSLTITTPSQLAEFLLSNHQGYLAECAVNMVESLGSGHSARIVATGKQGAVIGAVVTASLFLLAIAPDLLWFILHMAFSAVFVGCIVLRLFAGKHASSVRGPVQKIQHEYDVPVYSAMIALYREAEVVPQLVQAMRTMNWPRSRLEVLFLCEADDHVILAAFEQQNLPAGFRVIAVPGFGPRTKPKALNYGLQLTEGEFIVVYDAEDQPHPDQLHEAWQKFKQSDPGLGCLQAPLLIGNGCAGWIARLFAFEYAAQFSGLLPWLANGRYVLPLGGSSNHFRRECLLELGGWDPFNVTEDADLGTRLVRRGFYADVLTTPTLEDAPNQAGVWLKQRTRWLKGWMQTWLVEMRQPAVLFHQICLKRFIAYHLLMAGIVISALLYPFMLGFIVDSSLCFAFGYSTPFKSALLLFDILNVIMGFMSFHFLGRSVVKKEMLHGLILVWLPVYWLMISAAAWRALWQLHAAPFLWEKTPHVPANCKSLAQNSSGAGENGNF